MDMSKISAKTPFGMSVARLFAYTQKPEIIMCLTYFFTPMILLVALLMICPTFCLISTASYKLQVIHPSKSCRDSDVQLLLKSRVICAAINHPQPGQDFSLQISDSNLVCAQDVSSEVDTCQQVNYHSTANGSPFSFRQEKTTSTTDGTSTIAGNM